MTINIRPSRFCLPLLLLTLAAPCTRADSPGVTSAGTPPSVPGAPPNVGPATSGIPSDGTPVTKPSTGGIASGAVASPNSINGRNTSKTDERAHSKIKSNSPTTVTPIGTRTSNGSIGTGDTSGNANPTVGP